MFKNTALLPTKWLDYPLSTLARLAPLQEIDHPLLRQKKIHLSVKREDLLDPKLGGNKLYKLYAHIKAAKARCEQQNTPCILASFGGAYSNHLYALARAGESLSIPTLGVIRGEPSQTPSATLCDVEAMGMRLVYRSRTAYRSKEDLSFKQDVEREFGDSQQRPFYWIPEGGSGELGAQGCRALSVAIAEQLGAAPDVLACAVGTGATLAGLAAGLPAQSQALGVCVLKGADTIAEQAETLARQLGAKANIRVELRFHGGGYARLKPELRDFMQDFEQASGVPLDPVYTAKLFCGLFQMIAADHWPPGTHIVALHSGGLQGRRGFSCLSTDSSRSGFCSA